MARGIARCIHSYHIKSFALTPLALHDTPQEKLMLGAIHKGNGGNILTPLVMHPLLPNFHKIRNPTKKGHHPISHLHLEMFVMERHCRIG